MTRRRWIADRIEGDRAFLTGQNAEHLARVLRARVGQEFEIATSNTVRLGRVAAISDRSVEFELGDRLVQAVQGSVSLLLAVFKFDRMEWAIEKATELGVASIQPVIARRTETHLASAAAKRVERWRRIVREAAQQSRCASVPEIADPVRMKDALTVSADLRIVLAESEQKLMLKDALRQLATGGRRLATLLAIGPEGGWTDDELRAFTAAGWTAASLGPTILRAETAAIAALAIAAAFAAPCAPAR
jgi:16S rRNA (uracil1498-N3)-methyltransferase